MSDYQIPQVADKSMAEALANELLLQKLKAQAAPPPAFSLPPLQYGPPEGQQSVPPTVQPTTTQADPTQQLFQSLLTPLDQSAQIARRDALLQTAAQGPTKEDLEAAQLEAQARAMQSEQTADASIPVPQEQPYAPANLPPLELPAAPSQVRPQANALSSIAAGILGLVQPRAAGELGGAALAGAIERAQRENQQRQQAYQQQFQAAVVQNKADIERKDAENRVAMANNDTAYRNTVAQTNDRMRKAHEAAQQMELEGGASALRQYSAQEKPARAAASQAEAIDSDLKRQQTDADRRASLAVTAYDVAQNIKQKRDKEEADLAAKKLHDAEIDKREKERLASLEMRAKAANERALDVARIASGTRLKVTGMQQSGADSRLATTEKGRNDRFMTRFANSPRPQTTTEQTLYTRLQQALKQQSQELTLDIVSQEKGDTAEARKGLADAQAATDAFVDRAQSEYDAEVAKRPARSTQPYAPTVVKPTGGGKRFRFDPATGKVVPIQ
jgi:hypothetical protein